MSSDSHWNHPGVSRDFYCCMSLFVDSWQKGLAACRQICGVQLDLQISGVFSGWENVQSVQKAFSERRMRCASFSGISLSNSSISWRFLESCFEASLECHQASTTELIFCKRHGALVQHLQRTRRKLIEDPGAQVADFVSTSGVFQLFRICHELFAKNRFSTQFGQIW